MTWAVDHTSPAPSAVCFRNPLLYGLGLQWLGLLLVYLSQKDERLSWPRWLTHSGQFTHKVVTIQLFVRRRSGMTVKVRRSMTNVLPLCYASNIVIVMPYIICNKIIPLHAFFCQSLL